MPRCDTNGDCALWQIPRALTDFWADGGTVYMLEGLHYDSNNDSTTAKQRLFRADLATQSPPRVLAEVEPTRDEDFPAKVLGRYNAVTYVVAANINAIHDDGSVQILPSPPGYYRVAMHDHRLFFATSTNLWISDLSADAVPVAQLALTADIGSIILGDDVMLLNIGREYCSYPLMPALGEPLCNVPVNGDFPFAARGTAVFYQESVEAQGQTPSRGRVYFVDQLDASLHPQNPTETDLLQLSGARMAYTKLYGDTFFSWIKEDQGSARLVRFSASSLSTPVDVLPRAVVSQTWGPHPELGYMESVVNFSVTDAGIFWVPGYQTFEEYEFSRYVFHRAL